MKLFKKVSALLLAGVLLSGSCFYAAEQQNPAPPATEGQLQPGEVKATKDLVRDSEGNPKQNPDGSYTVKLSVKGKNTTKKITHADVVFIATHSQVNGSNITQSHKDFVKKVIESGEGNKVGVVTNCSACASHQITDNVSEINSYLESTTGGYTAERWEVGLQKPLTKAIELINARQDKSRPVYVFITGIKPGLNDITDPRQIEFLKMNRTHTILMGPEAAKEEAAFKNYGEVECIPYGGDLNAKVAAALNKWADEMFIKPAKAGTQAVMTDIVNTDVFDYEVKDPKLQDDKNGTLKWNIGDIPETEQSVTFNITPKAGKFGTFKTNKDVVLDYLDVADKPAKKLKPEIGDPELTLPEYTVTYTDGVEKYEIFKDQVYKELGNGSPTPKFVGKTTQKGWTFKGWTPEVADTVTGSVTYTAQWEEPVELSVTYTDGVDNEDVFEDVKYSYLREGDKTPQFTSDKTKVEEMNAWLKENFKAPRDYFDSAKPEENAGKPEGEQSQSDNSQKPGEDSAKPEENVKPEGEQQKPEGEQQTPVAKIKAMFEALANPEEQKPEEQKPEQDSAKPEENTGKPEENTGKPGDTTKPEGEEQKPGDTTKPEGEMQAPEITNEEPKREGYTFKGWTPEVTDIVKSSVTYTAQWEKIPTYTITYTDGVDNETIFEDKVFSDLRMDADTPKFGELPSRAGYMFKGWSPEVSEKVKGDATYTAQWEVIPEDVTYTVTYTDGVDNETIFEDKVFSELKPGVETPKFGGNPTRNGYTFEGWSPAVSETVTGNVTYVAQWKAIPLAPMPELPKTGVVATSVPLLGAIISGICVFRKHF